MSLLSPGSQLKRSLPEPSRATVDAEVAVHDVVAAAADEQLAAGAAGQRVGAGAAVERDGLVGERAVELVDADLVVAAAGGRRRSR